MDSTSISEERFGAPPEAFFYPYNTEDRNYFNGWRYVPDLEPGKEGDYLTDRLTDRAIDIVEELPERTVFPQSLVSYGPYSDRREAGISRKVPEQDR